jgi:hypothetical protein
MLIDFLPRIKSSLMMLICNLSPFIDEDSQQMIQPNAVWLKEVNAMNEITCHSDQS